MAARVQANALDLLGFHIGLRSVDSPLCWPSRICCYVLKSKRWSSLDLDRFSSCLGIRESDKYFGGRDTPQKSTRFLFAFDVEVKSKFIFGLNYWIEVNGQLHSPAALPWRNGSR
jgi:hypothetical protein